MKRCKTPKKNKQSQENVSTHYIMKVILPCTMLACKDIFNIKYDEKGQAKLNDLAKQIQHYINLIADGSVSQQELNSLMEVKESPIQAMAHLDIIAGRHENEKH